MPRQDSKHGDRTHRNTDNNNENKITAISPEKLNMGNGTYTTTQVYLLSCFSQNTFVFVQRHVDRNSEITRRTKLHPCLSPGKGRRERGEGGGGGARYSGIYREAPPKTGVTLAVCACMRMRLFITSK